MKKILSITSLLVFLVLQVGCKGEEYYTVKFETYGGTNYADVKVNENDKIDLNDYNPTREGYIFCGWSSQSEIELLIDSIQIIYEEGLYSPDSDITLTAIYMLDLSIKFTPAEDITSIEYKSWFLGNMDINVSGDVCMIKIEDYIGYLDFDGTRYYEINKYGDGYVGIYREPTFNFCKDFMSYGEISQDEEFLPELSYDNESDEYYSDKDGVKITLKVDDFGYIVYYKIENDEQGLIAEFKNINNVSFIIPEYEIYTPIEFVLLHYPDLDYDLTEQELVLSDDVWIANMDFDANKLTFIKDSVNYTFSYSTESFFDGEENEYTVLELIELDSSIDSNFFELSVEIYMNERNLNDYFNIPDPEINYIAPGNE